jgi:hypothetical protein
VVESSLGVPTGCAGKLRWQTTVMFGDVAMAEPWDGVGEAAMAVPIRHKRGLLAGCDAHPGGKTSLGTLQASAIWVQPVGTLQDCSMVSSSL